MEKCLDIGKEKLSGGLSCFTVITLVAVFFVLRSVYEDTVVIIMYYIRSKQMVFVFPW